MYNVSIVRNVQLIAQIPLQTIEKKSENRQETVAKHSHMLQLFYGILQLEKSHREFTAILIQSCIDMYRR